MMMMLMISIIIIIRMFSPCYFSFFTDTSLLAAVAAIQKERETKCSLSLSLSEKLYSLPFHHEKRFTSPPPPHSVVSPLENH